MEVNLTKEDLINLVKGTNPNYNQKAMSNPLVKANGVYHGGFNDYWEWNYNAFQENTEKEILEVYNLCK